MNDNQLDIINKLTKLNNKKVLMTSENENDLHSQNKSAQLTHGNVKRSLPEKNPSKLRGKYKKKPVQWVTFQNSIKKNYPNFRVNDAYVNFYTDIVNNDDPDEVVRKMNDWYRKKEGFITRKGVNNYTRLFWENLIKHLNEIGFKWNSESKQINFDYYEKFDQEEALARTNLRSEAENDTKVEQEISKDDLKKNNETKNETDKKHNGPVKEIELEHVGNVESAYEKYTSPKHIPNNKKVSSTIVDTPDLDGTLTVKSVKFQTPSPKSQKEVRYYLRNSTLKKFSASEQIMLLESCKSFLETHESNSETYIDLYNTTINKLQQSGALSKEILDADKNFENHMNEMSDTIKMYETSRLQQKSQLEEKIKRRNELKASFAKQQEKAKDKPDVEEDKPLDIHDLDTNENEKLDIKDLGLTQEQYEKELGILDSQIEELTKSISVLESKIKEEKEVKNPNNVKPENIDDLIGEKVKSPKPVKKQDVSSAMLESIPSPVKIDKKKKKVKKDSDDTPVDTRKPSKLVNVILKKKNIENQLEPLKQQMFKKIELATAYFDYREMKDLSRMDYQKGKYKGSVENPIKKKAKLIELAVGTYVQALDKYQNNKNGGLSVTQFQELKDKIIKEVNKRYNLRENYGFKLYSDKGTSITSRDLENNVLRNRVEKGYVNQNAPNKDTFFQYNMSDIYSIIEDFTQIKLSAHAKNSIEGIIKTSIKKFVDDADDKGYVVHHSIAHGVFSGDYEEITKYIEKYINARKNEHIKTKFELTSDARTKIIEIIKKEQSRHYNDINQKTSSILARLKQIYF